MWEFMVRFRSFRDVHEFANRCGDKPFKVSVGSDRYRVNGTSLLGMLSLNCRNPQRVTVNCTQEEFDRFRQEMKAFLAEE